MELKEQLAALLPGVEISDEFVTKLTASIETAVAHRVEEQTADIKQAAEEYKTACQVEIDEVAAKANAYAEYVVEEMTKKVEDYCEFVVEQFVKENLKKLVETEEYCRMAVTLRTIREVFEANYFQLNDVAPASRTLQDKLTESRNQFNDLFEQHRNLKQQVEAYSKYVERETRATIFEEVTKDLADTQKERVQKLIESANYPTIESYEQGLHLMISELQPALIKEQSGTSYKKVISEVVLPGRTEEPSKMQDYLSRL